jgi:hypothetical protein
MEVRQKIFDQITAVRLSINKENYKEGNISDENLQTLRDLQRDLFNLSSSFDRNGNKKEGSDFFIFILKFFSSNPDDDARDSNDQR